ncbi:hypothetical protein KIW84_072057 [Lathyrus oleraceus]|uniref:Retrovirus-related Pol polyprotein from transposon TNT 1-94 n=1 Tax=Pisum sativum TaxID=3888 RepID=A0A9D4VLY6_PEA|nr:hypothetical protein KIW84_072057 [Pisum sativum]
MIGKNSSFLALNASYSKDIWIIDSGATDHMTPYMSYLSSYSPLPNKCHITVAIGSQTPIFGFGNIRLSPSLHLNHVLHVPKLSNNLLSTHKLTKDLNCVITFFHSHCVFQDLAIGKTIGIAEEQNGLPSRVLSGVSPAQVLTRLFPSVPIMSSLQNCVFGYSAFVHVHGPHRGKLDPRAIKCIFIGYASDKKGYKCYHPPSRRVYISMDVTFQESESFNPTPQL